MTHSTFTEDSRANAIAARNAYVEWRKYINWHIQRAQEARWEAYQQQRATFDKRRAA